MIDRLRALNAVAQRRGQNLAPLAMAWALRDERVTSLVVGASSTDQLQQNVAALQNVSFTDAELVEIDQHASDGGVDLWKDARLGGVS